MTSHSHPPYYSQEDHPSLATRLIPLIGHSLLAGVPSLRKDHYGPTTSYDLSKGSIRVIHDREPYPEIVGNMTPRL